MCKKFFSRKDIETDFSDLSIIEEKDRKKALTNSLLHRGSVRISNGLFYTDEEYEQKRKEVLDLKLP